MIHIWHEDSMNSATTVFWNYLKYCKVNSKLENAEIVGFSGNKKLFDYVSNCKFNKNDVYIIFMDCVYDNLVVMEMYEKLNTVVSNKDNVFIMNLLSFEYLILSFKYFESWVRPLVNLNKYNYLCKVRSAFLLCVEEKSRLCQDAVLIDYMNRSFQARNIEKITTEQLATHLLSDFTGSLKGDFIITKKHLGSCWTCTCCDKYKKDLNKKCSHAVNKKTTKDKAFNLYNNSLAHTYL